MFRMNGTSRWSTRMCGAKPPWGFGRDFPVAHGPDSRHHSPSATIVLSIGDVIDVSRAGVVSDCQDRERQDVATEPTGMSLWRVLAITNHPGSPPTIQWDSNEYWSLYFRLTNSTITDCRYLLKFPFSGPDTLVLWRKLHFFKETLQ